MLLNFCLLIKQLHRSYTRVVFDTQVLPQIPVYNMGYFQSSSLIVGLCLQTYCAAIIKCYGRYWMYAYPLQKSCLFVYVFVCYAVR